MGYTAVPAAKYVGPDNWEKHLERRGKFGKYNKETFTAEVMRIEK
jgi:hypothetical protein